MAVSEAGGPHTLEENVEWRKEREESVVHSKCSKCVASRAPVRAYVSI